ncbi:MAG: HAD-IIIA family hydrolase [Lachnospiraceae bacterium]|nr:HAD-IIIA family hydrolase [Lachnospiraceae bacterium]
MKAVIMAGGRGTRMASVSGSIPKPMIPMEGKPVLEYGIDCLRRQSITEIILIVGHLSSVIEEYFGDGSRFGVKICYIREQKPLGTAGGLWYLKDMLQEDFLLINGDLIFDVDLKRFAAYHKSRGGEATILTHPNHHPYDSGVIETDSDGAVVKWLHKEDARTFYKNRVNAGIHMLSPEVLKRIKKPEKLDLDRELLRALIPEGKLMAYDSPEYVKDMGTPKRYEMVKKELKSGLVQAKNLSRRQRAVFFDRDGVLNVFRGFIRRPKDLELTEEAAQAVRKVNGSGYLAIVVTNQPVIARGECTEKMLEEIHNKLETLLGQEAAYLDDIFYCPHHPEGGFAGERPELKIVCGCRKPKPGLLLQAAQKYNIDLAQSYMIGDSATDVDAGHAAGCRKSFLLDETCSLLDAVAEICQKEQEMEQKITEILEDLLCRYPALETQRKNIEEAYRILENAYCSRGKLLVAGNGGSAADAEHIVGELMKGFRKDRKLKEFQIAELEKIDPAAGREIGMKLQGALPAIAVTGNLALSTAYANDVDLRLGFAQQVYGYGNEEDVFLGISTSGNSENILLACTAAKAKGMKVIGLTGRDGGKLKEAADAAILVDAQETYQIQEMHLPVYHALCRMLEERFFA